MPRPGRENPQRTVLGNAAPIHVADAPAHVAADHSAQRHHMVAWAHWGIEERAHFIYDEGPHRSDMFHRKPGDVSSAIHADCSQFYASIAHWCGVAIVDDRDYTGTLLKKGKRVKVPRPGDCVIFGPGTGTHAAMICEAAGNDWWTIGFGHQGAPNRVLLSGMEAYFNQHGHPGVTFLSFAP